MKFVFQSLLPISLLLVLCPPLEVGVYAQQSLTPPTVSAPTSSGSSTQTTLPSGSTSANVSVTGTATSTSFPSLSTYSTCVVNCLTLSVAQAGCDSTVNVQCFCSSTNSTRFARSMVSCISSQCPTDLASGESVGQLFCNLASPSITLSYLTPTANATTSSSSSSRSQSVTAPPSSSPSPSDGSLNATSGTSSTAAPSQTGNSATAAIGISREGVIGWFLNSFVVGMGLIGFGAFGF
ncbi:RBT5 family protein [Abortiporus biennis]